MLALALGQRFLRDVEVGRHPLHVVVIVQPFHQGQNLFAGFGVQIDRRAGNAGNLRQVGGEAANFLDIGGGANADVMAGALEVINDDPRGFVKILSDPATGVVLGGSIVGRQAAELISVLAVAVTNGLRVNDIVESLLVHPSLAEALADAAE